MSEPTVMKSMPDDPFDTLPPLAAFTRAKAVKMAKVHVATEIAKALGRGENCCSVEMYTHHTIMMEIMDELRERGYMVGMGGPMLSIQWPIA